MFDEEFGLYNENSLDVLLKFSSSNEQEEECPWTDLFSSPNKECLQTDESLGHAQEELAADPLAVEQS